MKVTIEFEKMKQVMLAAAKSQGLSDEYVTKNWAIDYRNDLDEEFAITVNYLNEDIKLLSQSLEKKDFITSIVSIVRLKIRAQVLMDFFEDINDDFIELGWGELKEKWPEIPEDYKVPEGYDYEDTNKPFSERIVQESNYIKTLKENNEE